jgi:hypothetical protein
MLEEMGKGSAAAKVIDLEAFRRKKMREEERASEERSTSMHAAMFVPVWYCWVPVWAPVT